MSRPRTRAVAVAAALIAAALGLAAAPASAAPAAPPSILLSTDGVTFAPTIDHELFDSIGLLVPGDTQSASLWVKNDTARDAYLRLTISDLVVPLTEFTDAIVLTTTSGALTQTDQLADLVVCSAVLRSAPIEAGNVLRIDLAVSMDPGLVWQEAQDEHGSIDFSVAMRDITFGPYPAADGCIGGNEAGPEAGPEMAHTGADAVPTILIAAAALLSGFIAIIVARRRSRRQDEVRP